MFKMMLGVRVPEDNEKQHFHRFLPQDGRRVSGWNLLKVDVWVQSGNQKPQLVWRNVFVCHTVSMSSAQFEAIPPRSKR